MPQKKTDQLSESTKRLISSADAQKAKMDEDIRISELFDKEAIDKEIMDINRTLKTTGDEYRKLFLERKAIEQIPGRGTQADLDAINKRQRELEAQSKELQAKRDALNKQAITAINKQAEDEAAVQAEKSQKMLDDQFKADQERTQRRDELEKELNRSFELSGISDEFDKRLQTIRNDFADTMDKIRKEFDGQQETELLGKAESALQAELNRAADDETEKRLAKAKANAKRGGGGDANPDAVQRGTAQAYSAIIRAMRGDAEKKHLKAIEVATKATADAVKAQANKTPVELTVVETL